MTQFRFLEQLWVEGVDAIVKARKVPHLIVFIVFVLMTITDLMFAGVYG